MSDANKNIAVQCFKAGNLAIEKGNFDYATKMYGTSVKVDPASLIYRQALRGAQQKMYGDNGTGVSMAQVKMVGLKPRLVKARRNKDWKGLGEAAEEGLAINPWDIQCNIDLGDACRELDFDEVAIFSYEQVLKKDPENRYVNETLANLLADRGEYERARACCSRILKADPHNGQIRTLKASLDARQTLDRGGYDKAEGTQGVLADHEIQKRLKLNQTADAPGMSPELDLQHAIRKDPANFQNHLKLADLYKRQEKFEEASRELQLALQLSNNDVNIREVKEDLDLDILRNNWAKAKELAGRTKDPLDQKRSGDVAQELLLQEVEVFKRRVERYPSDMRLKFELGLRYMRMRQWGLAIPLFQRSVGDNRIKGPSLINLGKCFMYDGKIPIARSMLEKALPEIEHDHFPDEFKDLHYTLGRLCEELKDVVKATEHYQNVMSVDYDYRDARARNDKLHGDTEGPRFELPPEFSAE